MQAPISVTLTSGAPPLAVVVFEVLLNASSMFTPGNVRLPGGLDDLLRLLVVTPEMHRVHHSVIQRENDSLPDSLDFHRGHALNNILSDKAPMSISI